MTVWIEQIERDEIKQWLISPEVVGTISDDDHAIMANALAKSTTIWAAMRNEKVLGFWGVMLPTLISDTVYLWLYTTENFAENCFVCVRQSQIIVRALLAEYPKIIGHCIQGEEKSIRWLRWLGARFSPIEGNLIPFEIKAA